jgi:hypothetical protein
LVPADGLRDPMPPAWVLARLMLFVNSDDLNIVENHCYSNVTLSRFNSNVLTMGFYMLTEFYRDRNTLEASRLFNEKVTVFAGLETVFPVLSEAGYGSSCYNFLR